jgi:branched-subunit amino acid aminotransferase/4-amino-4-deoxychorismate lyase
MFKTADEVFITSSSGGVTPTTITGDTTKFLVSQYELKKEQYATNL